MRNLLNIDFFENGVSSIDTGNSVELIIKPLENQKTNFKVEVTTSSIHTHIAELNNGYINYIMPFEYWSYVGVLKMRLLSNEGNSSYITITNNNLLITTDNIIVKYSDGNYELSIVKKQGTSLENKLGFVRAIIVEDFNNIMENGIYYQDGNHNASQCPNIPTPYAGKLVVNNSKSAYPTIYQVYHSYGLSNTIYYRTYYNGIWYTWKNTNEIDGRRSVDFMNRGSWWDINDFSKNANNENNNINFAYANTHGTATTGTLVTFSCTKGSYQLQIQGDYGHNNLWFRNKNGDKHIWGPWLRVLTTNDLKSVRSINIDDKYNELVATVQEQQKQIGYLMEKIK